MTDDGGDDGQPDDSDSRLPDDGDSDTGLPDGGDSDDTDSRTSAGDDESLFDRDFERALEGAEMPSVVNGPDPNDFERFDADFDDSGPPMSNVDDSRIADVGDSPIVNGGGSPIVNDGDSSIVGSGVSPKADDAVSPIGDVGGSMTTDDVDSSLPRIELGIDGLDRMIQGGIPERSLMVVIGSPGTGKTTCGLQFLNHGLEHGERAVYITLEEEGDRVIDSATEKGWPFDEYVEGGDLVVLDMDPVEMATHLETIQDELPELIAGFDASRLVLDSVSLLEMMYEDRASRRNDIYDFTQRLKAAGVTALLTSEAAEHTPYASRYGIVEYLTDAVFVLQHVRPDDFRQTRLAVEIQKIRDANHSREMKPYEITNEGISVHQQANLF